jgi:nicotinamidase-related amidase
VKVLLVIDVQNGVYRWGEHTVHGGERFLGVVSELIAAARGAGVPVAFVQHADEELIEGSEDFDLVHGLDVREGDIRVVKHHGSAFHGTDLRAQLSALGVDEVIVCGLQTEHCVDSTMRHARTLGLPVTLVGDANSTFDTPELSAAQIIAHHNGVHASWAPVVSAWDLIGELAGQSNKRIERTP